ncbi:hypothetical protein LY56_01327 [Roseinatronobacter thiooxidans]|uniref:Uncharacterized protein n=1 Tax=Roseinatronobacter thiooxidans TaxID=121821 RepID=A0A2W7QPH4_9RHOB|nr:hypothetical protein LY56_01327 [Roseinatronobacter thiooxidans]
MIPVPSNTRVGHEYAQQEPLCSEFETHRLVKRDVARKIIGQHDTSPGHGCAIRSSMVISTLAYRTVVSMDLCHKSAPTDCKVAPLRSRWVAAEWRSKFAPRDGGSSMPARVKA